MKTNKTLLLTLFLICSFYGQSQTDNLSLFVDGVCGMCKDRIEAAAIKAPGVKSADWNIEERNLSVTVDDASFDELQLHWAITGVGHDTDQWKASDETYANLHFCCRYRDQEVIDQHQPDAKTSVRGLIHEEGKRGKLIPIIGATVSWQGTSEGSVTDIDGEFELPAPAGEANLVISYVGFDNDTINTLGQPYVEITLAGAVLLDQVEVNYRRRSTEVSFIDPLKIQQIGSEELFKAACCSLAESFETNPAVDASVTDAVTGTRQIEMLGLAGPYVQISRESMPDIRGLSSLYGLTFTPGAWIESIQLLKGPGSVVNGFESIAGQINVQLKKPQHGETFHFNAYTNEGGRIEGNTNWRYQINENLSTGFLLHGEYQQNKNDRNKDGFLDNTLKKDWIAINRWKWSGNNGWEGQFGVKGTFLNRQSGQINFDIENGSPDLWGAQVETERLEAWAKTGKVFSNRPFESIGFQVAVAQHQQNSFFGLREWNAEQRSIYGNFIFQHLAPNGKQEWKAGLSLQYDDYEEQLAANNFDRKEVVPGAFFEYTWKPSDQFTAVLGLRGDHHNTYGFFVTPRAFLRYAPNDNAVLRVSAGQGRRTANIIAENIGFLASSRQVALQSQNTTDPYGLNQEIAWNAGINWTQNIPLGQRDLLFNVDIYRTWFEQQVVIDLDQQTQEVHFYNLSGESYSNSIQLQLDYELFPRFDLRLAYRFNDVKTDYETGLLEKPLISRHRAFINLAYETNNNWSFDFTLNRQGRRRIPNTQSNPAEYQLAAYSPSYFLSNGQISKTWKDIFTIYVGGENLFDFVQKAPILASATPFGPYFDASMIWGPVFGRMLYVGVRYTIDK